MEDEEADGKEKWVKANRPAEDMRVLAVRFHRNGICGAPFSIVRFLYWDPDTGRPHRMVATVFEAKYHTAVLDLNDLETCWRGDRFEDELRKAISNWE